MQPGPAPWGGALWAGITNLVLLNEFDHRIQALRKQQRESLKNSDLNEDSNPCLCDAGAVLNQLSYQAN